MASAVAPELGFRIGFNTGQSRRVRPNGGCRAEHRIKHIPPDPEFRNQQVAGSIPAGGSMFSTIRFEHLWSASLRDLSPEQRAAIETLLPY